ncbi:type II toxin-antitoxin system Phd/YefM family antitoxin [bacterium]|nr:type II toxin-antitoxin system Phd/YefM family antitoxin [bacterium]
MRQVTASITIPAAIARTQLGSLLRQITEQKKRFVITKGGKPTAVLLGIEDFDDILEELDPEFQRSLNVARREYSSGKLITLKDYVKTRLAARK